jgi:hypothetical protein
VELAKAAYETHADWTDAAQVEDEEVSELVDHAEDIDNSEVGLEKRMADIQAAVDKLEEEKVTPPESVWAESVSEEGEKGEQHENPEKGKQKENPEKGKQKKEPHPSDSISQTAARGLSPAPAQLVSCSINPLSGLIPLPCLTPEPMPPAFLEAVQDRPMQPMDVLAAAHLHNGCYGLQ